MGRRALPKIDPAVDFSAYLKMVEETEGTLEPAKLFGRDAPLEIEVGCGKGLFMGNVTGLRPEHNFIGVEVAKKYARFAAHRLAMNDRSNGLIFSGDALQLLRENIAEESVTALHVYFPDPWWKGRHRKRRVLNQSFLKDAERVLLDDGILHIWTDVQEYFDSTVKLIGEHSILAGPFSVDEPEVTHDLDYRTHFERRTRLDNRPVYRAQFKRPAR